MYPTGIPSIWTTNDRENTRQKAINTFGDHCWMVEMQMDCSQTTDGWFQVSASMKNAADQASQEQQGKVLAPSTCEGPNGLIDMSAIPKPSSGHLAK